MDGCKVFSRLHAAFATLLVFAAVTVNGQQIRTPCTGSMISSLTPCLNFITGSSGNGASPTVGCCNSLVSLMNASMDCTCLIITGGVPFSLPSNALAISLPRACKTSLPLQCKSSGVNLPAPGPALFGPSPPPVAASPLSPRASKAVALAPVGETTATTPVASPSTEPLAPTATSIPVGETTATTPVASPSTEPLAPTATSIPAQLAPTATGIPTSIPAQLAPTAAGIRPVLTPAASASNPSSMTSFLLLPLLVALLVYKLY